MSKKIKKRTWRKALKEVQKDLTKKIGLFDRMEDECFSCGEPFDKNDIVQVREWHVVVKRDPDVVRLYCPECFQNATKIVKDFHERVEERDD